MADLAQLSNPPSKVSYVLAANRLGVASVVFFIVAAAAPLTTAAGGVIAGYAVTGVLGLPVAYAVVALIFAVFAVGYVAMSRHITNAGALYTYVVHGLGRIPGVGASFVALLAYNAMQIGLYGIFGTALSNLIATMFAAAVPWWVCALAGWAVIGVVGVLRVDVNGRVLAALLIAECLVVVGYDLVFVTHPAGGELTFDTIDPANLVTVGWGATLAVAIAGFVGLEGGAVFAEETKDPRRTVARATYIGIAFIGVIYTLSSWALSVITGPGNVVAAARQQGTMLLFNLGAGYVGRLVTDLGQILFITSLFAALLSFHNTVARYLFSLGREQVLPRGLGSTHHRTGSPYAGSLTQSALALLVLIIAATGGADPVVQLFFIGTNIGAFGVLVLMTATSFAVIAYFQRRTDVESEWRRTLAPALAGVLLLVALAVVLANFHALLGVPPDDPRGWVVPAHFAAVAVAGLLWGWFLRIQRPAVYRTIGLGANRVTGRAISELDGQTVVIAAAPSIVDGTGGARTMAPVRTELTFQRLHTKGEVDTVAGVLAEALHPDEPGEWLIPDPYVRAQVYPAFFRIHALHALRGAGEVYVSSDRSAVAIWYPAPYGVPDAGPADYDAQLAAITGPYLPRFLALDSAIQAAHPIDKAHHYLSFLGVRPSHQGRGIGSALLTHRLSDLHRRGIPTYLEATNRRNLALFLHHGFTVIGTVRVPDGGPTMYRMWRGI
ncbi:MAG TPA: GNAT family N-acetyltransferase [Actinophytocola sp.]|uniref:GNAT family N-acetyltransferase n=1 Tax=Actinophytocola sp. TaxID=1872138 RepID=UPI002DDD9D61|nr:GNAT family N-acetyltransferase [Actinophytocola sp.]HEV2781126.1 GNAT family N-acetyltransferase [Actinophytocola sp.]